MSRALKILFGLLMVLALTGASIDLDRSDNKESDERRRRGGGCVSYLYYLINRDAIRIEHHDAVEWTVRPVVSGGVLSASGIIEGDKEMFTGEGWVIFNVNEHNKDIRVANILKPGPSYSISNKSAEDIHATEWNVNPKSFSIEAPFTVDAPEDLDLIVWGTDVAHQGLPLSMIKIQGNP